MFFIGRTSRGEPFLTGDKSGVTKFQLSLRAQCELQTRFVGSLINASTEAFCFLVLKGKFRLQQRQFALARKIVFVSDSLHTENKQKKMSRENTINVNEGISTEIDFEGMIPDYNDVA